MRLLSEKKDNKPVFDIHASNYISRVNIECNRNNTPILFNNGYAPALIHSGSLSIEAQNSYMNQLIYIYFYQFLLNFHYILE